jgi:hypothetical protein
MLGSILDRSLAATPLRDLIPRELKKANRRRLCWDGPK